MRNRAQEKINSLPDTVSIYELRPFIQTKVRYSYLNPNQEMLVRSYTKSLPPTRRIPLGVAIIKEYKSQGSRLLVYYVRGRLLWSVGRPRTREPTRSHDGRGQTCSRS